MKITIPNNWKPRKYQLPTLKALDKGYKRVVSVWHRRAGKDTTALNYTAKRMMTKVGNYWHLFPLQTQARKAIWKGINKNGIPILDQVFPPEIVKSKNSTEMIIELINGSTWQLCGSDNYNSLVGSNPVGVVFSEWSLCNPNAWAYIRPILAENKGWSWFIYTPRGKNHGYTLYNLAKKSKDWFCSLLTVDDTDSVDADTLNTEHDEMDESDFLQEYYCSFDAAIKGSFYGECLNKAREEGRITKVDYDVNRPVYTAWDLGYSDDTSIWFFQVVQNEVHIIDFYSTNGEDIQHYVDILNDKEYEYEMHYIPHDARAKTLASGGKSVQEQLAELLTWGKVRVVANLSVQDGIQAARKMLKNTWFDEGRCELGLYALENYQREWDEKGLCFKKIPLHNWASHPADAFRYVAVAYKKEIEEIKVIDTNYTDYGLYDEEDEESWKLT